MSAPCPGDMEPAAGAETAGKAAGSGWDLGTQVQIRVAIEAAEDDEPDTVDYRGGLEGGSCSEDDFSRNDKYR